MELLVNEMLRPVTCVVMESNCTDDGLVRRIFPFACVALFACVVSRLIALQSSASCLFNTYQLALRTIFFYTSIGTTGNTRTAFQMLCEYEVLDLHCFLLF